MASFAKLDLNNIVTTVESVSNNVLNNPATGQEEEVRGLNFLRNLYNEPEAVWKQTSYNTAGGVHKLGGTPFRKNHAAIDYTYDESRDAFLYPAPTSTPSFILNETTCLWEAPVAIPDLALLSEAQIYMWNEDTTSWDIYNLADYSTQPDESLLGENQEYAWDSDTKSWSIQNIG